MNVLEWNPEWETGIERIDTQHRELLAQIESLMQAIHDREAESRIPGLLVFLEGYVEGHFMDEESQMEASGYPGLNAHRSIHDGMRRRVAALLVEYQEDPACITDDILDFLSDWLINHITGEDRRMARHLIQWNGTPSQSPV
jgi:hemerythrin